MHFSLHKKSVDVIALPKDLPFATSYPGGFAVIIAIFLHIPLISPRVLVPLVAVVSSAAAIVQSNDAKLT
jgi:hypothetical protein